MTSWLRFALFAALCCSALPACTGLSLGENDPGGSLGTYLEDGSIAVDPRSETVYVVRRRVLDTGRVQKELFAVHPDTLTPRRLADVSDLSDLRLVFPAGQVLLLGELNGVDHLRVLDAETGAVLRDIPTRARYHGTRLSPSGRFLVVADNNQPDVPVHLIDTETYETTVLPHDGDWLEAMWGNEGDLLFALIGYDGPYDAPETSRIRLMAWDVRALGDNDWPRDGAFMANPIFDLERQGARRDFLFSHSWIGVSPSDALAVFPVRVYRPEDRVSAGPGPFTNPDWKVDLLIVDVATGALREVANAFGPVGFTPDGTGIVSYRYEQVARVGVQDDFHPSLLIIDTVSLDAEEVPVPLDGLPSFHVTREGHWVVVADVFAGEQLVLYDLDSGETSRVAGPWAGLGEFVTRVGHPELWLIDGDELMHLDLMGASLSRVPLSRDVHRINIQRTRDRLVLGDRAGERLTFFDPSESVEIATVIMPTPVERHLEVACIEQWCAEPAPALLER